MKYATKVNVNNHLSLDLQTDYQNKIFRHHISEYTYEVYTIRDLE